MATSPSTCVACAVWLRQLRSRLTLRNAPASAEKTIDIWWLGDEGGLALLVPYLMSQSEQFKVQACVGACVGLPRVARTSLTGLPRL